MVAVLLLLAAISQYAALLTMVRMVSGAAVQVDGTATRSIEYQLVSLVCFARPHCGLATFQAHLLSL
jgi:hypothetical protein